MLVNIALVQQATFHSEFSALRSPGQSLTAYVDSELSRRVEHVLNKMKVAAETANRGHSKSECLYFVLPEFFWNVPWSVVANPQELLALNDIYFKRVSECVSALLENLPPEVYGHVVLLAGTCATVVEVDNATRTEGEVINYLLAGSNEKKNAEGKPALLMWPKRHVSQIDFGRNEESGPDHWVFKLSDGVRVKVKKKSSTLAESNSAAGYKKYFFNSIVPGGPFGINLCLDYAVVSEVERVNEFSDWNPKMDFLVACGMEFDRAKRYLDSVQFAFRNDGMGKGGCEAMSVLNGYLDKPLPTEVIDNDIHLVQVNIK